MHISKNSLDKFVADFSTFFPQRGNSGTLEWSQVDLRQSHRNPETFPILDRLLIFFRFCQKGLEKISHSILNACLPIVLRANGHFILLSQKETKRNIFCLHQYCFNCPVVFLYLYFVLWLTTRKYLASAGALKLNFLCHDWFVSSVKRMLHHKTSNYG